MLQSDKCLSRSTYLDSTVMKRANRNSTKEVESHRLDEVQKKLSQQ